jgi:DHA1 family tetracycline resistance protein-like MFS transporter
MGCEITALVVTGLSTQGWIVFAICPLFALGGIGMPALQSMTTQQVDADNQGKLQGVLASLVSLSAVFGPLFFSAVYFLFRPTWPGAIWVAGATVYLLALPLMLGIRRSPENRANPAVSGQ